MVFRGDEGDLSVLTAGGGERDQAQFSDTSKFLQPAPPPLSPLQKSIRLDETSKGSTYIITGITISIGPQSFGSGIILETLRALHFFHVVLRKFRVAIRGAAAMIQNKSCNATFPQDTPGYNELENSWHAPLLSRFFSNTFISISLSPISVLLGVNKMVTNFRQYCLGGEKRHLQVTYWRFFLYPFQFCYSVRLCD